MSARFSVVLQDNEGAAMIGQDVDLYAGASPTIPGAHTDMTDNSDGSYYCSVSASGIYTVVVGGTIHDEMQGIYITVDDGATAQDLADHENADGAGGDDTPATNKVHNASAIELKDSAGRFSASDVEAGLAELAGSGRTTQTVKANADDIDTLETAMTAVKGTGWVDENLVDVSEKIGDMVFTTAYYLKSLSSPDITECLTELANRIYQNYLVMIGESGYNKQELVFYFDTNTIGHPTSKTSIVNFRLDRDIIIESIQAYDQGVGADYPWFIYLDVGSTQPITYGDQRITFVEGDPGLVESGDFNEQAAYGQYVGIAVKFGASESARQYGHIIVTLKDS